MPDAERRLILLGSTGSIGTQTLDVVAHLNAEHERSGSGVRYRVVGLAARRRADVLFQQAERFGVSDLALADGAAGGGAGRDARVLRGPDAAERLVRQVDADVVLAAMVGSAGLPATMAAIDLGRDVALANKETLVAAGALVVPAARRSGARLLPVDSEHAAIWQCLQDASTARALCPPCDAPVSVRRLILTASGGPFRSRSADEVYNATPAEALDHPTWRMGPKVTIDSASLTNKALEVIEAHWLFGFGADRIDVLVHPQSIVHSFVEFADGNVIAQLGPPDMRMPIQLALTFPARPPGRAARLDLSALAHLDFEPPDIERFPALALAYEVVRAGGTAGAVFNAANEAAVEAFLESGPDGGGLPFGRIPELTAEAIRSIGVSPLRDLKDVMNADRQARRFVRSRLGAGATG